MTQHHFEGLRWQRHQCLMQTVKLHVKWDSQAATGRSPCCMLAGGGRGGGAGASSVLRHQCLMQAGRLHVGRDTGMWDEIQAGCHQQIHACVLTMHGGRRWWRQGWGTCPSRSVRWSPPRGSSTWEWTLPSACAACPSSAQGSPWRMPCAPAARASRLARSLCTGELA